MTVRGRWMCVGIAAAIVAGSAIRIAGAGSLSLWFDEGYTAWAVNHPTGELLRIISADTSPPLYYVILHGWRQLFGDSEAGLRSLSVACGIATLALIPLIAIRLPHKSSLSIFTATCLFALNYFAVEYSQEARSYEMTALLAALLLFFLLAHLAAPSWRWLAAFTVTAAIGLYVNNFMLLYIAAMGVSAIVFRSQLSIRRRVAQGAIVAVCLLVVYVPWIGSLFSQMHRVQQDFWIERPTFTAVCEEVTRICGVGHFWTWDQYVHGLFADVATGLPRAFALLLIAAILVGSLIFRGCERRNLLGLAIIALGPPLAAAAYSQWRKPIFLPAGFLPSTVPVAILIADALGHLRLRFATPLVVGAIALSLVNLVSYELERTKEDWRDAASLVAQMPAVDHRLIVFVANEGQLPFDYYYQLRPGETETGAPQGFFDVDPPRTQRRVLSQDDLAWLREKLTSEHFDDVVLVSAHTDYSDPQELTSHFLQKLWREEEEDDLSQKITIRRFLPR